MDRNLPSDDDLKTFYSVDRTIFMRLVITLFRDPFQSLRVIGLWLWLESIHYPYVVLRLADVSYGVLNVVADEAVHLLNLLDSEEVPVLGEYNFNSTENVIGVPISVQNIYEKRDEARTSIITAINNALIRAFADIIQLASLFRSATTRINRFPLLPDVNPTPAPSANMPGREAFVPYNTMNRPVMPQPYAGLFVNNSTLGGRGFNMFPYWSVPHPQIMWHPNQGSVHERGELSSVPPSQIMSHTSHGSVHERGESSSSNHPQVTKFGVVLEPGDTSSRPYRSPPVLARSNAISAQREDEDNKTMFMTFSRGYSVTEIELRDYIEGNYGSCIQRIVMENTPLQIQPLYARVIFKSVLTIFKILNGRDRVKFIINGNHVWARRFEKKNRPPRSPVPPRLRRNRSM